jgi:hypothetical protein
MRADTGVSDPYRSVPFGKPLLIHHPSPSLHDTALTESGATKRRNKRRPQRSRSIMALLLTGRDASQG